VSAPGAVKMAGPGRFELLLPCDVTIFRFEKAFKQSSIRVVNLQIGGSVETWHEKIKLLTVPPELYFLIVYGSSLNEVVSWSLWWICARKAVRKRGGLLENFGHSKPKVCELLWVGLCPQQHTAPAQLMNARTRYERTFQA
jgi:hypothetical protein